MQCFRLSLAIRDALKAIKYLLWVFLTPLYGCGHFDTELVGSDVSWNGTDVAEFRGLASASDTKDIRVLFVHGISCHDPNYSAEFQNTIARKMGFRRHEIPLGSSSPENTQSHTTPYFDMIGLTTDSPEVYIRQYEHDNTSRRDRNYGFERCGDGQWYDTPAIIIRRFHSNDPLPERRWLTFYEVFWSPYGERQKADRMNFDLSKPKECFTPNWAREIHTHSSKVWIIDALTGDEVRNGCADRIVNPAKRFAKSRSMVSKFIKHEIINSRLSDAVFYLGDGGQLVTNLVTRALCAMMVDDPTREERIATPIGADICDPFFQPAQVLDNPHAYSSEAFLFASNKIDDLMKEMPSTTPDVFLIADSLGSRATFDSFLNIFQLAEGNPFANILAARFLSSTKTFFMFGNQAPFFEIAELDREEEFLSAFADSREEFLKSLLSGDPRLDYDWFLQLVERQCLAQQNGLSSEQGEVTDDTKYFGLFLINFMKNCLNQENLFVELFPGKSDSLTTWSSEWVDAFLDVCFTSVENSNAIGRSSFASMFEAATFSAEVQEQYVNTLDLYRDTEMWEQNESLILQYLLLEAKTKRSAPARRLIDTYATDNIELLYVIEPIGARMAAMRTLEDELIETDWIERIEETDENEGTFVAKFRAYDKYVKKLALEASGFHLFMGCFPARQALAVIRDNALNPLFWDVSPDLLGNIAKGVTLSEQDVQEWNIAADRAFYTSIIAEQTNSIIEESIRKLETRAVTKNFRQITHIKALDNRMDLLFDFRDLLSGKQTETPEQAHFRASTIRERLQAVRSTDGEFYDIVTISDDNDVLSYRIPDSFKEKYDVFDYVNVKRQFGFDFGIISNIPAHHLGHKKDKITQDLVVCGLMRDRIDQFNECRSRLKPVP